MPEIIEINIPNVHSALPFKVGVEKKVLPLKYDCLETCGQDNFCTDCDNDLPFAYSAVPGDTLHLQFLLEDTFNLDPLNPTYGWNVDDTTHWLELDLMNADGTVALADITNESWMGQYVTGFAVGNTEGISWQNVNIRFTDLMLLRLNCEDFYFRVKVCTSSLDIPDDNLWLFIASAPVLADITAQASDWTGNMIVLTDSGIVLVSDGENWVVNPTQPVNGDYAWFVYQGQWHELIAGNWEKDVTYEPEYNNVCEEFRYCASVPFKKVRCEETVHVCSNPASVPAIDCNGTIYGTEPTQEVGDWEYSNCFRFPAWFELTCLSPQNEITDGGAVISETLTSDYVLQAVLPEVVARRLAAAFMIQGFTVEGMTFDSVSEVCKNNDEGNDWHVNIKLGKEECRGIGNECE